MFIGELNVLPVDIPEDIQFSIDLNAGDITWKSIEEGFLKHLPVNPVPDHPIRKSIVLLIFKFILIFFFKVRKIK